MINVNRTTTERCEKNDTKFEKGFLCVCGEKLPRMPPPKTTNDWNMNPIMVNEIPTKYKIIITKETRQDSTEGIRSILSDGPDVVTSIFCRYSSNTASISVELSESVSLWWASVVGDCNASTSWFVDWAGVVKEDVSCSSSIITVFRGDAGSPSNNHSRSISSFFFFLLRDFGLGIATIDGLLKHRKIRPAVDTFEFDWKSDVLTDCFIVVCGFSWLYPNDVLSTNEK